MERTSKVLVAGCLVVSLTSCADMTPRERNTAIGAGVGGVVGNVVTGGSALGTAAGAAAGAYIGHETTHRRYYY